MQSASRGSWSSAAGFVLASMGSAVGLGNVWRYPYITGQYGGAAFILVYICCVLAIGIPLMLAEFLIGRKTQRNPVGAFREPPARLAMGLYRMARRRRQLRNSLLLRGRRRLGLALHLSLADQCLYRQNARASLRPFCQSRRKFLAANFRLMIFMLLTVGIVAQGVSKGIEIGNKIMMPLLFALLVGLLVYAVQTDGAAAGLAFLLRPRWQKLGPAAFLDALGQALFSLSLGMGAMITYGSYLSRQTNLLRCTFFVVIGDTLVAILAGFVVFPLVFTFGLEPGAGPGLIFQTLPIAFAQLPAGYWVALAFFVLLSFAALTSSISLLEVACAYFVDEQRWSRKRASWSLGTVIFVLGIPSALSGTFLGFMDGVATNYLLPIGALLIAVFTGWALLPGERQKEFSAGEVSEFRFTVWSFLIRFVSPVGSF